MKLFISYSNEDRHLLDDSSVKVALERNNIECWNDERIENGENFPEIIRKNIQECQSCLFFATSNSIKSEWCKMEIAAFWAVGKKLYIYNPNGNVKDEDFPNYLRNINYRGKGKEIADHIKAEFDQMTINGSENLVDKLEILRDEIKPAKLFNASTFTESKPMLVVANKYAEKTGNNFNNLKSSYLSISATDYPEYLIRLQQNEFCRVKAIAVVDEIERFWDGDIGDRILSVSEPENIQRVFVFKQQDDFSRVKRAIKDHCLEYDVRLISQNYLNYYSSRKIYDFSLIWFSEKSLDSMKEPPLGTILASYKTENGYVKIEFTTNDNRVQDHWRWYHRTYTEAHEPRRAQNNKDKIDMQRTQEIIFEQERKEMSHYIPDVRKYDRAERLHPYFEDMRSLMVIRPLARIRILAVPAII
ncbi:MAG: toll/interleukin-1 receptor domain-containing protein [Cyanobacteria bacterium J06621_8]